MNSREISVVLNCEACGVTDFEISEVCADSRSVNQPEATLFLLLKG